jgi:uncharacterized small protein (DUF1192 family)
MPGPDDLAALKAERARADREYNEALTRLDRAIQQLPAFPHPPPAPDEYQITPLNTLWTIDLPAPGGRFRGRFARAVRRVIAPLFDQQRAFNSAIVDHLNRNAPIARVTQESIAATIAMQRDTIANLIRFQGLLIVFLQQITAYVDTRDRDVAGLLRGLSGAINAVADEVMKRSEAMLARDRRHALRVGELESRMAALQEQIAAFQATMERRP